MIRPIIDRNFQNKVDIEIIALVNLVDRSFPLPKAKIRGWQEFLLIALETCKTTYAAVKYLSADFPDDPDRDVEFGLTIPLLNRLLADLLFHLIFIKQRPAQFCRWYHQAGWRELSELTERYKHLKNKPPNWNMEILKMEGKRDYLSRMFKIPMKKVKSPHLIDYWPIPSRMRNKKMCSKKTYEFLDFLFLWIYRDLSQHSHFSGAGIVRSYSVLLLEKHQGREKALKEIRWRNFLMATTLMLAICTEVNHVGKFGRNQNLSYLWILLVKQFGSAEDLYKKRYKLFLK